MENREKLVRLRSWCWCCQDLGRAGEIPHCRAWKLVKSDLLMRLLLLLAFFCFCSLSSVPIQALEYCHRPTLSGSLRCGPPLTRNSRAAPSSFTPGSGTGRFQWTVPCCRQVRNAFGGQLRAATTLMHIIIRKAALVLCSKRAPATWM